MTQQEGFKKVNEGENYLTLERYIEDIEIGVFLMKNHEEELYCWLLEKESLYPGEMASGFKSALNRALGLTNPNIDRRRYFKIGDISVYGGSVFYPRVKSGYFQDKKIDSGVFQETFSVDGGETIIIIEAFKIER